MVTAMTVMALTLVAGADLMSWRSMSDRAFASARAFECSEVELVGAPPSAPAPPAAPAAQTPEPTAPTRSGGAVREQPPDTAVGGEVAAAVQPTSPETETSDDPAEHEDERRGDEVVRVGSSYVLAAGDRIDQMVVVMGNATVDGHVAGDLVVVLGDANLGPMAVVDGDVAVVGGSLSVREGASADRDVVVVGGGLNAPSSFMPGGLQVVIGFKALGDGVRGVLPWLLRGPLWGRPLVPDLPWVWAVLGVLLVVYLGVLVVFETPVRATAAVLRATPLKAFVTGLAVVVLFLPILLLLAATVVGLLVVPVALCALIAAGIVGRVASAGWLGARIVPEGDDANRLRFVRSFAVGCAVLIVAYMVPVLGGLVWALLGATGLGAAALAFASAYRRENPPVAPAAPPMPQMPAAGYAATAFAATGTVSPLSPTDPHANRTVPFSASPPPPTAASSSQALALMPRASFTDRLAAFVLDAILVAITIGILPTLDDEAFVPLFLGYRFVMWVWKGVTVGGIICQLRITKVDGSAMSGGEALVRSLGSLFSVAVFGIGCLWVLRDPDRQSWHDKMAGTYVVKVPRNWPM